LVSVAVFTIKPIHHHFYVTPFPERAGRLPLGQASKREEAGLSVTGYPRSGAPLPVGKRGVTLSKSTRERDRERDREKERKREREKERKREREKERKRERERERERKRETQMMPTRLYVAQTQTVHRGHVNFNQKQSSMNKV